MARYIDANALKESILCSGSDEPKILSPKQLREVLLSWIDSRPTADVAEVVRCKDCKWYEGSIMETHFGVCCHPDWVDDNCGFEVSENGWCYRGERKNDEAD